MVTPASKETRYGHFIDVFAEDASPSCITSTSKDLAKERPGQEVTRQIKKGWRVTATLKDLLHSKAKQLTIGLGLRLVLLPCPSRVTHLVHTGIGRHVKQNQLLLNVAVTLEASIVVGFGDGVAFAPDVRADGKELPASRQRGWHVGVYDRLGEACGYLQQAVSFRGGPSTMTSIAQIA